ncbi:hypothetical protein CDAR_194201 [Caerostris darwini]|uniref:LAGLIDADG homing endonuclease n=1 Tax=Caerostris darwini TaxID=1538125 RepID=A0AAV4Q2L3_9ARAC|nr:hypothetical protein CDAR_194201 [Caerostris darwini]
MHKIKEKEKPPREAVSPSDHLGVSVSISRPPLQIIKGLFQALLTGSWRGAFLTPANEHCFFDAESQKLVRELQRFHLDNRKIYHQNETVPRGVIFPTFSRSQQKVLNFVLWEKYPGTKGTKHL